MFSWTEFTVFSVACWALILSPGPDMIYVITRGVSQGRAAGLLSAGGVIGGTLVHTLFAAFGLSIVLHTSALAFMVVKFAGAAYLIYLGIQALRSKDLFRLNGAKPKESARKVFMQGVMSNVLNPKIAVFFLAFLPQFVDPSQPDATARMAALGLIFALFGLIFLIPLGWFAGQAGGWLCRRPTLAGRVKYFTGSVLIALGLRLAVSERS